MSANWWRPDPVFCGHRCACRTAKIPTNRTRKPFKVWLTNREKCDAINVGDQFDVGPCLVR
jgi:hypothetical protein